MKVLFCLRRGAHERRKRVTMFQEPSPETVAALHALAQTAGGTAIHIVHTRICDHCQDASQEAFPYHVPDRDGTVWAHLCNDCFDSLGCSYPTDDQADCPCCGLPGAGNSKQVTIAADDLLCILRLAVHSKLRAEAGHIGAFMRIGKALNDVGLTYDAVAVEMLEKSEAQKRKELGGPMSATNRGAQRVTNDLYPTPAPPINALLSVLRYSGIRTFHEPCKGLGAIYDRIECRYKSYCEIAEGKDYLTYTAPHHYDLIVTNPPFSLALPFLKKSLQEAATVIYLLRLNFLGSRERRPFWHANRPTHVLTLAERPIFVWTCRPHKGEKRGCGASYLPASTDTCICGRRVGPSTDSIEYAWFCWDRAGLVTLPPGVHVL